MRVLHVHSGNIFGGIETMLLTQVRYQHLCPSLEFEFALCFGGRLHDELTAMGAPIYDLGAVRLRDPLSVRRARRELDQLLRREKFDAIVTHSCWTQTVFATSLRAPGAPLVFYLHAPPDGRHWLERLAKRTPPDLVLCNSTFTADSISVLYAGVKTEIATYPVALSEVASEENRGNLRTKLQTRKAAKVIIQVSRMERWKGHELHLAALAKLREVSNWECWIVGGAQRDFEHRYVEKLEHMAQKLGLADRVRFLGQRDDVNNLLLAADIFCQPNLVGEPFGISFIEALQAGLPVVTCDIGAARETINDTCGIRVPRGSVDLLADALQRLIQNDDERTRLGRGGPVRARQLCDPATQLNQFQRAISSLTRQRVCATALNNEISCR